MILAFLADCRLQKPGSPPIVWKRRQSSHALPKNNEGNKMSKHLQIELGGKMVRVNSASGVVEILNLAGDVAATAKIQDAAGSAQGEFSEIFED
jgi:hypothetical protein